MRRGAQATTTPRLARLTRLGRLATFAALAHAGSGCALVQPPLRPLDASLAIGRSSEPAPFERRAAPAPAPAKTPASVPVFWTAVITSAVASVAAIGLGIAGERQERQLEEGYRARLSERDADDHAARGRRANRWAGVSLGVAAASAAVALVTWGHDFSRCGPLAPARRDCTSSHEPAVATGAKPGPAQD